MVFYTYWSFLGLANLSIPYLIVSRLWMRLSRQGTSLEIQLQQHLPVPDQDDEQQIAIVTGSNTGIGYETAKCLVVDYGYTVILACRSRDKGQRAADEINSIVASKQKNNNSKQPSGVATFVTPLDLSSMESVRAFCKEINRLFPNKIHLLVNNAGLNALGKVSPFHENLDLTFQSNFLGHFLLTSELINNIVSSKDKKKRRIINLSSVMHHFCGNCNFYSIEFWKSVAAARQPGKFKESTYPLSKLSAILFSMELNRRYKNHGIISIAVNPGAVNSDIWRDFPRFVTKLFELLYLSVQQGCRTSVAAGMLDEKNLPLDGNHCCYLQPYWIPNIPLIDRQTVPFPLYEMMGPFQGYRIVKPRLPLPLKSKASVGVNDEVLLEATEALWAACEELTGCTWPEF